MGTKSLLTHYVSDDQAPGIVRGISNYDITLVKTSYYKSHLKYLKSSLCSHVKIVNTRAWKTTKMTFLFNTKLQLEENCFHHSVIQGIWKIQSLAVLRCVLFHKVLIDSLRWRHNDHAGVSNHQPHGCLLNRLFRRKSKKTSKLRVTGLCVGNSPGTGEFPAQMASYAENVSIWWRHHVLPIYF